MSEQHFNIKFVEEVEKHEVLYNHTLPGYSKKDQTEKAWQRVAVKCNMDVTACKKKWRNLRTVLMRKIKHSGTRKYRNAYYLSDAMQFCVPFIKVHYENSPQTLKFEPTEENFEHVDINDDIKYCLEDLSEMADSPLSSTSPQSVIIQGPPSPHSALPEKIAMEVDKSVDAIFSTKTDEEVQIAKTPATNSHNIERKEALKMFLLSLIPEMEDFSDLQIKMFKRRTFSLIDEISMQS